MAPSSVHDESADLTFRVDQKEHWGGRYHSTTIAAAGAISLAREAFEAACRLYPDKWLVLRQGSRVIQERMGP